MKLVAIGLLGVLSFAGATAQQFSADSLMEAVTKHRNSRNIEMKGDDSPIPAKERKRFKGLKYFPVDPAYCVRAVFTKTETPDLFRMRTTTARQPEYRKYGEIRFRLAGAEYKLDVFQSPEISGKEGYEDYLFIPFTDLTNGGSTYEIGRYLEMRIPAGNDVVIDFNLAYNPYCSYNKAYSCPIPPEANTLSLHVTAGEKKYH